MYINHTLNQQSTIWNVLIERLLRKKSDQKQIAVSSFEDNPAHSDYGRPQPRDQLVLDADRRYRHNGVNGWKLQGHSPNGKLRLSTDVYKHIDLEELRSLNKELNEGIEPKIGSAYQIRRSNGSFEKFTYIGINPANKKLVMAKLDGHTESVSEEELARENSRFDSPRYRHA